MLQHFRLRDPEVEAGDKGLGEFVDPVLRKVLGKAIEKNLAPTACHVRGSDAYVTYTIA
jgi:hypothetical protein